MDDVPMPGAEAEITAPPALRVQQEQGCLSVFFAGDWTQTGLPATIESAVASGHACAELALMRLGLAAS